MSRSWTLAWLVALAACKAEHREPPPAPTPTPAPTPAPTAPAPPAIDRAALLEGKLPDGDPATELVNAQCRICHSVDYLTQQRLGEQAWKKTIEKMRKFGAKLSDAEVAMLVAYGARYWNADLPARTWPAVAPPPGALPPAAR